MPENRGLGRGPLARRFARELFCAALPAALGLGLFLVLPVDSRSQSEASRPEQVREPATLCGAWHRGSGETVPLDLGRVKRAYQDLKAQVTRSVESLRPERPVELGKPYDAGLPACRETLTRSVAVSQDLAERLERRTLYFASLPRTGTLPLPSELEGDSNRTVLVVRASALRQMPQLADLLGRPVSLGTAEFARSLGVRCTNTWVRVSLKGDALELHEAP